MGHAHLLQKVPGHPDRSTTQKTVREWPKKAKCWQKARSLATARIDLQVTSYGTPPTCPWAGVEGVVQAQVISPMSRSMDFRGSRILRTNSLLLKRGGRSGPLLRPCWGIVGRGGEGIADLQLQSPSSKPTTGTVRSPAPGIYSNPC